MKKVVLLCLMLFILLSGCNNSEEKISQKRPNFIIIFADDLGYGDIGCFGSPNIKTPNIDKMASEGMKLTNFYAQTVCGPSRAALMTGCYPMRNARTDNGTSPHPKLALSEVTIAEVLKPVGYKTCMIGKWDLAGHNPEKFSENLLPIHQGFDESFFTPGSNDSRVHLLRNNELIEKNADMSKLTKRYTNETLDFIDRNMEHPFFIYLAHTMPHTKLAVSDEFKGTSKRGLYGDVVEEIDYNVGRILDKLKEKGLDENTYIIFTSDNGPWWIKKEHGGSAEPLRGAKTSAWDGGFKVPTIICAPGKISEGVEVNQVTATIDLLPTIASIAGAKIPTDRVLDGVDISGLLKESNKELDRVFYYYQHRELRAVRKGNWKLHLPHKPDSTSVVYRKWPIHSAPKDRVLFTKPMLYNLKNDIGETIDVSVENPQVVAELTELLNWAKEDIGDWDKRGVNARVLGDEPYQTPNRFFTSNKK